MEQSNLLTEIAIKRYGKHRVFMKNLFPVIHFPEIIVTNTAGNSKKIFDVFLMFKLAANREGDARMLSVNKESCMLAARTTFEYEEAEARYLHSHVYSSGGLDANKFIRGNIGYFGKFCLRGNPIPAMLVDITHGITSAPMETKLLKLLVSAERLLHTEDTVGVPVSTLTNCGYFTDLPSVSTLMPILSDDRFYDLKLDNNHNLKINDHNLGILNELYPEYKGILRNGTWCKPKTRVVSNYPALVEDLNTIAAEYNLILYDLDGNEVVFKGKVIPNQEDQVEIDPDMMRIPPAFIEMLSSRVRATVSHYHAKKLLNERAAQAQD